MNESITRQIYEGFATARFELWDGVVHPDVVTNSPLGQNMVGLPALKGWAVEFHKAFQPTIDLADEFATDSRALITVTMHWRHTGEFFGHKGTGRAGTSIENFVLTLTDGLVTRWDVADATLDLVVYLIAERGFPYPQNVIPPALIKGIRGWPLPSASTG
jgi:hypothetical protein